VLSTSEIPRSFHKIPRSAESVNNEISKVTEKEDYDEM